MKRALIVGLLVVLAGCGAMAATGVDDPSAFLSIEEVLDACGADSACGAAGFCEGRTVRVRGYIDYGNVFDKAHHPQLPYEKFTIRQRRTATGAALEVWVEGPESREVFREIHRHAARPDVMAHVQGELVGFDMPVMGTCRRGVRIHLTRAKDLFFR